ncbi:MAG: hypothetical protein LUD16_05185 [Lachnospiraceae bacterium]|nr:hypothetical protein [Lachnospiraceae bacterium]
MKKGMYFFLGMMCAGFVFAGTPAAAEEEQTGEAVLEEVSGSEVSEENESEEYSILQELIEPNMLSELADKYGRASFTVTWIAADGTESSWSAYRDAARYVYEKETLFLVDDAGDVYGIDYAEGGVGFRYIFVGDAYDEFQETYEAHSHFTYNEIEQIVSQETSDGLIYLEAIAYFTDDYVTPNLEDYGYEESAYEYEYTEYTIDEETYEILSTKTYVGAGDEMTLVAYGALNVDPEEVVVDEELTEAIFGEDVRTLSVVTDAGTDEEAVYTQTVTQGGEFLVYHSEAFENVFYTDPECTEIAEDTTQYETVYLKRIEEE